MTLEQAVQHFGNQSRLAEALGITPGAIPQWKNGIPMRRQYQLQAMTNGALVADKEQSSK